MADAVAVSVAEVVLSMRPVPFFVIFSACASCEKYVASAHTVCLAVVYEPVTAGVQVLVSIRAPAGP